MKKSPDTPDSEAPGILLKHVTDIPEVTLSLYSPIGLGSHLYFRSASDNEVKVARTPSPSLFLRWRFYKVGTGIYNIRSYPDSHLYLTWDTRKVFARSHSGYTDQNWEVFHAPNGRVYIRAWPADGSEGYLSVNRNFVEGEAVFLAPLTLDETVDFVLAIAP